MNDYIEIAKKYKQDGLLKNLSICDEKQKEKIILQIKKINFEELKMLYDISKSNNVSKVESSTIECIKYIDKNNIEKGFKDKLKNIGEEIIKNNNYAVVTMAGGQGTRLEHNGPKGTYLLNIKPKEKSLFEILADSLKTINCKYNICLNWYIMTSDENNDETVKFFEKNNFFNYPRKYIKFFRQGNMPILNEQGKLVLDENYNIKFAADGNGCVYKSMKEAGILADMKIKNIQWVFIGSVDNVILDMADPILLGLTIYEKNEVASKSIVKANPYEKVGVFCKINSKPSVIEYSEIPEELANKRNENGDLEYGESHIMCNLFSLNALEYIANLKLPYHSAHKKIQYLNEDGKLIVPEQPNAYKYETFIFDAFNFFDNMTILRGIREEDFAPVKNKDGIDSPITAIKMYNKKFDK